MNITMNPVWIRERRELSAPSARIELPSQAIANHKIFSNRIDSLSNK